jgi:hypothetical protein
MTLYFNAKELPESTPEYVAWVDVMGTQSVMSRSLSIAANFIFKLHTAALDAQKKTDGNIHLYPVMDGLYASSSSQEAILYFLRSVFCKIAETLILEENNMYRFIVRGALAFGPIIHGKNVSEKTSNVLGCEPGIQYKNAIFLGMPIVQSCQGEKNAPPLGLFVHESARAFAPEGTNPLHDVWWKWCTGGNVDTRQTWSKSQKALEEYFIWCKDHAQSILYPSKRIEVHSELVRQYFAK